MGVSHRIIGSDLPVTHVALALEQLLSSLCGPVIAKSFTTLVTFRRVGINHHPPRLNRLHAHYDEHWSHLFNTFEVWVQDGCLKVSRMLASAIFKLHSEQLLMSLWHCTKYACLDEATRLFRLASNVLQDLTL